MCGIYGVIGSNACEKVLSGLKLLQYRGYDSCGIAYYDNGFKTEKAVGSLDNLIHIAQNKTIAFGHTRWATNGIVNIDNAHPHISFNGEITIVHNGIIKNADEIKELLLKKGIEFYSSTDTEVIANYIAFHSEREKIEDVLKSLFDCLEGSFSLIIGMRSGELYLVKKFSPLNVLITNDEIHISSDVSSLHNGKLYSMKDNDILKIANKEIYKINGEEIEFVTHKNDIKNLQLNKYAHFMQKEIFETPKAIKQTYQSIKDIDFNAILSEFKRFTFIGCGTAYHSCLIGEYLLKNGLNKQVETLLASNYQVKRKINKKHLHIIVSQSGETADCIKVAEQIKKFGGKILVITNEKLSTIAKMADFDIFTNAEKEIAVASTKTYCCQLFVFAYICNCLKNKDYKLNIDNFVSNLEAFLNNLNIDEIAIRVKNIDRMILIAKDIDYITILEASLKIREIDYVYTLPMYAGELKHGTLSLIEGGRVVLTLDSEKSSKLQNSINEIKARNGEIIDMSHFIPTSVDFCYKPIYSIIPFQLLSYKISVLNGRNPDMPRNLAKSVTVE